MKLFICVLLCAPTLWANESKPLTTDQKIQAIFDQAMEDNRIASWVDTRLNRYLKDPMDAEVDSILKTHPLVRRAMGEIIARLKVQIGHRRLGLLTRATLSMNDLGEKHNQYPELKNETIEIAKKLHFPTKSRKDPYVFVVGSPDINAYTYSALPSFLDLAFFEGLIELMEPEEVTAVIGHEVAHIKARHVLNRVLLVTIFILTGEDLLSEETEEVKARLARLKSVSKQFLFNHVNHYPSLDQGVKSQLQKFLETDLQIVTDSLRQSAKNPREILSLFRQLRKGLGMEEEEEGEEVEQITEEDIERFEMALERYSRSCETSADRMGMTVTTKKGSQGAQMKLLSSRATSEGVSRQLKLLGDIFDEHPHMVEQTMDGQGTHPANIARVAQFDKFSRSPQYLIFSDPFLKALDTYFALGEATVRLKRREAKGQNSPDELLSKQVGSHRIEQFRKFENQLSNLLSKAIVKDLAKKDSTDKSHLFQNFLEYLKFFEEQNRRVSMNVFASRRGLFYLLIRKLNSENPSEANERSKKHPDLFASRGNQSRRWQT